PGVPDQGLAMRIEKSIALYAARPSQAEAEPKGDEYADDVGKASMSDLSLIAQLREAVASRPKDIDGLALLANNEAAIENYRAAWRAKAQANALMGSVITAQDLLDQAAWMIEAAQGLVTPESEAVLKQAAALDSENKTIRYYLGLHALQVQRPDYAFQIWDRIYREVEQGDPLATILDQQLPTVALLAGAAFSPRPELATTEAPNIPAMVEGLYARLMSDGGAKEEWAMLIRSLMVQDDITRALQVHDAAKTAYADDAEALALFQKAFDEGGLVEQ
ncbi:MAG: hypothetical protein ABI459_10590, partial [Deltaproteobacteria bacterium]